MERCPKVLRQAYELAKKNGWPQEKIDAAMREAGGG